MKAPFRLAGPLAVLPLLLSASCSEEFKPSGDGAFIQGRVEESFTEIPAVNLGIGLEYIMEAAPASPGADLSPAAVTLEVPYPNPAMDTTRIVVTLTEPVPDHRLVVEAYSRQWPGEWAEWENLAVGANAVTWDLRDKFSGQYLPNGLYFVRLLDGSSQVLAETRLFINRGARESTILQAFLTFTDANGDFIIDDVAVGETFTARSASGTVLGTRRPRDRLFLHHDDFEYAYQELELFISPNQGVRFDFTVDPVGSAPEPLVQGTLHP